MEMILCNNNTTSLLDAFSLETFAKLDDDTDQFNVQLYGKNNFLKAHSNHVKFYGLKSYQMISHKKLFNLLKTFDVKNVFSLAGPKSDKKNEFAVGLTTGGIQVIDFKSGGVQIDIKSNRFNNCVNSIEFNAEHQSLLSLYENGDLKVFNVTNTQRPYHIFTELSDVPVTAKFHPFFNIGVVYGTKTGNVMFYDAEKNSKLFKKHGAHSTVCRDLAISPTNQNCLVSAGYDGKINVFDMRNNNEEIQINQQYPLNTVSLSSCGNYLCAGDLKGEITCYDLRVLPNKLIKKQLNDGVIKHLSFLPSNNNHSRDSIINQRESISNRYSIDSIMGQRNKLSFGFNNVDSTYLDNISQLSSFSNMELHEVEDEAFKHKDADIINENYKPRYTDEFNSKIRSRSTLLVKNLNNWESDRRASSTKTENKENIDTNMKPTANNVDTSREFNSESRIDLIQKQVNDLQKEIKNISPILTKMIDNISTFKNTLESRLFEFSNEIQLDMNVIHQQLKTVVANDDFVMDYVNTLREVERKRELLEKYRLNSNLN